MKNEKGITLIAFVITVIIMLILAGVAISVLTGDGGLFDKTLKSAEAYENAAQKEAKQLDDLMNEIDGYIGDLTADKKAPSVAKLEVSNITDTGFTLTATGKDNEGIAKYEFYIKNSDGTFTLEKTIESEDTTVTYDVTGKTMKQNSYVYKLKVYDKAGNSKESTEFVVGTQLAPNLVSIGDYINYDAGTWTQEDLNKITSSAGSPTLHSTVSDDVMGNQTVPTKQGEFGGFELGQSRNTNSIEYNSSNKPRTSGWRVWEINSETGVVTLISAGYSEMYYHAKGQSLASLNILKNRNYTMYVNDYATEAYVLTGQEAARWYNTRFKTSYTIVENGTTTSSTFCAQTFLTEEPISVLEIGSSYLLASAYSSNALYFVNTGARYVGRGTLDAGRGVRVLISLKNTVLLEQGTGNGSVDNPWKIAEM